MRSFTRAQRLLLWASSILALLFLAFDSSHRLASIRSLNALRITEFPTPRPDSTSPTGYQFGQHDLILSSLGIDGYHWILQTEQAMTTGSARVREVAYDNALDARDVHWASPFRWWAGSLAGLYRLRHADLTGPQALERVAPVANTLLMVMLLSGATWLLAWQLGAQAAAVFSLGSVTAYPFYEYFVVGYFDHHAIATFGCMLGVLLLALGGAGWIHDDGQARPARGGHAVNSIGHVNARQTARVWFVSAAVMLSISLWISAATATLVLFGVCLGALACIAWTVDARSAEGQVKFEPALWRVWGIAGATMSVLFYVIEYVPFHMGLRLEVNHPLYAAAWLAAGDLLAQVGEWRQRTSARESTSPAMQNTLVPRGFRRWRFVLDVAAILLIPGIILVSGESSFKLANPFLWDLHDRFILEFLGLPFHLALLGRPEIFAHVSLVPLAVLPIAALLWTQSRGNKRSQQAFLILVAGIGSAFAGIVLFSVVGPANGVDRAALDPSRAMNAWAPALSIAALSAVIALCFQIMKLNGARQLGIQARTALTLAMFPTVLTLGFSVLQVRWLGVATGLGLILMVALVTSLSMFSQQIAPSGIAKTPRANVARLPRSSFPVAAVLVALVLTLLPYPAYAVAGAFSSRGSGPRLQTEDVQQLVVREVAHRLRARMGSAPITVFSSPAPTSRLVYFGGFRGVGTYYWENLAGLEQSVALLDARTAEEARSLIRDFGITHLVSFSWDSGFEALRSASVRATSGERANVSTSFVQQLMAAPIPSVGNGLPPWLSPLAYPLPATGILARAHVLILEVVENQEPEIHLVRVAQFLGVLGERDLAEEALRRSLAIRRSAPALAYLAQMQHAMLDEPGFLETLQELRSLLKTSEPMELIDHINVVVALGLAGHVAEASREFEVAFARSDEPAVRRLPPESLVIFRDLSERLGVTERREDLLELATDLLPTSASGNIRR